MVFNEFRLKFGLILFGTVISVVISDYCSQNYICKGSCYRTGTYYTRCGGWWWWSGYCIKYRVYSFSCDKICTRQVCCLGYTGNSCNEPLCYGSLTCPNGGICESPDNCSCPEGYTQPVCAAIDACTAGTHDCDHVCKQTTDSYACACRAGYDLSADNRTCIENCGDPGVIANGMVSVNSTYLGDQAIYICNEDYIMSRGDSVRECRENFTWSGEEPICTFSAYCGNSPCVNGGTCVELAEDFKCDCPVGFNGTVCENDNQYPLVFGCSDDVYINATSQTVYYNWTEPTFNDTNGAELEIVSNYNSSEFTFPWGDFKVQYVATKVSTGASTDCEFQIKVRPTPCDELNIPANGARLCNGWKTDFGRFCMITCQQNFTISPSRSFYTWYVCGASGAWIAASPVPDCEVQIDSVAEAEHYQPEYSGFVYSSTCNDEVTRESLQNLYIEHLKGTEGFSSFCSENEEECKKDNVEVKC